MADYFAVLNRTLSGFTDPKPQLREKLYERARATIERQLQMKSPAPDAATMLSEMQKLEEAIGDIERGYDPDYVNVPVGGVAEPAEVAVEEQIPEPVPVPEPEPEIVAEVEKIPESVVEPTPVEDPAFIEPEVPAAAEQPIAQEIVPEYVADPEPVYQEPAAQELPLADTPSFEPVVDSAVEPVAASAVEPDPLDAWADEFLSNDPAAAPTQQPAEVEQPYVPPAAPAEPVHEIPNFDDYAAEELVIPPATAHVAPAKPKRKFGKWLLMLFILLLLGAAGTYGWMYKDNLIDQFGLSEYLDDPTRPKPVKTITITPEPEQPETEPQSETQDTPKSETRLTESGEEVTPEPTTTTPEVTLPPSVGETAEPIKPVVAGSSPVVAQSAILYEEGSSPDKNSIDSGRVVWSVVQESTGNGEETAPAIRGRVEIPDRSAVLIMTIKRNSDQALPASHLIELIFAVPDNFSGGTIENINRYVLKENEQGQGEALVGVPARIADGIFLIALNNLDDAKKKNVSLLRERDWIDIPMQYRTGRRALMTIEKGVPGEKVFKEVFDAWDKLDAS